MKGILFLCVANSARSQMAEGIARSLAPPGTKVWSAGSRPTGVRPEAIAVLKEIGIDISGHCSKPVAEIAADEVDTVVTLCAEEECPVFLGRARRLHWGLSDPAAVNGSEKERLAAFRETRDELRQACYSKDGQSFTYMEVYRMISLYPYRIALTKTDGLVDGWRILETLRGLVNSTWSRRNEITPTDKMCQKPLAMDLPGKL